MVRQRHLAGDRRTQEGHHYAGAPISQRRIRRDRARRAPRATVDGRRPRIESGVVRTAISRRFPYSRSRLDDWRELVLEQVLRAFAERDSRGSHAAAHGHAVVRSGLEPDLPCRVRIVGEMMRWPRIRSLVLMLAIAVCAPMVRVSAQSVGTVTSADTLVDGSGLNDIWLHINARDWQDLHTNYQEGTYYPVDFEWQGVKVRNSGIRVRGNTTRNDHKPSFRIDFNRYVDGQDLFGLKALVLNNSWHDPSMLHDELSMQTFRKMGIPAPRQAHVRLYVGAAHEYAGVYVISEEISKTFLTANFGEDNGYLYEFHRQDGDNYGFQEQPELGWYIPRFGPKTHETESVANLYTPVRNLVEAVNEARQDNLEDRLGDYFDVRTFITELAVQNVLAQTDGLVGGVGMNN